MNCKMGIGPICTDFAVRLRNDFNSVKWGLKAYVLNRVSFFLSEISRSNANSTASLPQNHWKTGKPSGNFNMTRYDENITKVLTYIYGDDLSLNQSDFENPDWRMKVIGPNDKNSNWTFIHSMYNFILFSLFSTI